MSPNSLLGQPWLFSLWGLYSCAAEETSTPIRMQANALELVLASLGKKKRKRKKKPMASAAARAMLASTQRAQPLALGGSIRCREVVAARMFECASGSWALAGTCEARLSDRCIDWWICELFNSLIGYLIICSHQGPCPHTEYVLKCVPMWLVCNLLHVKRR